jgi:hypothetical protein
MVSFPRLRVNIESGSMPAQQMLVEVTFSAGCLFAASSLALERSAARF